MDHHRRNHHQSGRQRRPWWDSTGTRQPRGGTRTFSDAGTGSTISVTINALPDTIPVAGAVVTCENSLETYFVTGTAGSTYQWTVVTEPLSGPTSGTSVNVNGDSRFGSLFVVETNAANCAGPVNPVNVIVNPRLLPAIIDRGNRHLHGSTGWVYNLPIPDRPMRLLTNGRVISVNATTDTLTSAGLRGLGAVAW